MTRAILLLLSLAPAAAVLADDGIILDARYRYESVEQSNLARDASAYTLRVRFGYETDRYAGFYALIDGEGVVDLGGDHDDTDNGAIGFPVIADPDGSELNQAFVGWNRRAFDARLGLQRITVGDQRFIGSAAFRQREQTFDAFTLRWERRDYRLRAGYLSRVQRVFGADHSVDALAESDLDSGFLEGSVEFGDFELTGLYMFHSDQRTPATGHENLSVALEGDHGIFGWRAEFADQSPAKRGSPGNDADYSHVSGTLGLSFVELGFGQETLGGDGTYAFQTPLASRHKFNGLADQFLITPASGLVDSYTRFRFGGRRAGLTLVWHDFEADAGGADLGDEWGLILRFPLGSLDLSIEYADYSGTPTRPDVEKTWVTLHYAL